MKPDENNFGNRREDVEIGFGPLKLKAHGRNVIAVVIVLAIIGVIVWHDWKSTQQNTAVVDALQAVSYVLTLSDVERKALRLQMPDALREKLAKSHER